MEGGIIYGGDFLSEILILHVDSAGEDLYKKLVEVIKESGHNIQKVAIEYCDMSLFWLLVRAISIKII